MNRQSIGWAGGLCISMSFAAIASAGDWIAFEEDTVTRLVADAEVGVNDAAEKAYAWGDVDHDGDVDLVVVRKEPFNAPGKRRNVLFMNEGVDEGHAIDGVLVDRTEQYASASTVEGDEGFLTPTNDGDVTLVDVNGDGWVDMVTAVMLSDGDPAHLKLPRVYINLGEAKGQWQGFRYEADRVEDFTPKDFPDAAPRFHTVDGGDLNGDGAPDLFFTGAESGGEMLFDFDSRVLINDGDGYFTDQTDTVITNPDMIETGIWSTAAIADMNNDGANDIVRQLVGPPFQDVSVVYNDPKNIGVMTGLDIVFTSVPTYISVGELNDDNLPDIVVTSDFFDFALLSNGIDAEGQTNYALTQLPDSQSFGGDSVVADLDSDGRNDVIITDADEVIAGCARETLIYRNQSDQSNPSFTAESAGIPMFTREGVHDAAVFDLNGDGALDIVFGRCFSTSIWIQDIEVCAADLDGSSDVNVADLLTLLSNWGADGVGADLAEPNDVVNVADLLTLLGDWGACE